MRNTVQLGEIGGIKVRASLSWFGFLVLMMAMMALFYFPNTAAYSDWGTGLYISTALSITLIFALSVLAHELAHALLIRAFGIKVNAVMLFFFGGVTLSEGEPKRPLHEFVVAVSGPLVSTALGLGFLFAAIPLGLDPSHPTPTSVVAVLLAILNLAMGAFNLLPGLPLDGGKALRAIAWAISKDPYKADRVAAIGGQVVGYAVIMGGIIVGWLARDWLLGFFTAYVGYMLLQQARYALREIVGRRVMTTTVARTVMLPLDNQVPPSLTLDEAVQRFVVGRTSLESRLQLVVGLGGAVLGLIAPADISRVPRELWPTMTVRQKMSPLGETVDVKPDTPLLDVLKLMEEQHAAVAFVTDEGEKVGLLDRPALAIYLARALNISVSNPYRERRDE